jgi:hypothetical protein
MKAEIFRAISSVTEILNFFDTFKNQSPVADEDYRHLVKLDSQVSLACRSVGIDLSMFEPTHPIPTIWNGHTGIRYDHFQERVGSRFREVDWRRLLITVQVQLEGVLETLGQNQADALPALGFMGVDELGAVHGVHPARAKAFAQALSRIRTTIGDGLWIESANPQPNISTYLYRADSEAIRNLAAQYTAPKPD